MATAATLPRQASDPKASCVALGRRFIFAAMRSATLAVKPFARIRSISHFQARLSESKTSRPSSASAAIN